MCGKERPAHSIGHAWSDALELELRYDTRTCGRGAWGPIRNEEQLTCRKLANLTITVDSLWSEGPNWRHDGTLRACRWAMFEDELSTARCVQVTVFSARRCGRRVFNLLAINSDPQTSAKNRTHSCACSPLVAGGARPCVLPWWAGSCAMPRSNTLQQRHIRFPRMRPLWPFVGGKFVSKTSARHTFSETRGVDTDRHKSHGARLPSHRGTGHSSGSSGRVVDSGVCRRRSTAVLEYVRNCHVSSAMYVTTQVTHELRIMEVWENMYQ